MEGNQDTEPLRPLPVPDQAEAHEPSPTVTGPSFMFGPTETPRPVEQSAEPQIQALMGELDHQNGQLGGRLLAKLPTIGPRSKRGHIFYERNYSSNRF